MIILNNEKLDFIKKIPGLHLQDIPSELFISAEMQIIRFFDFIYDTIEVNINQEIKKYIVKFPFIRAGGSVIVKVNTLTTISEYNESYAVESMKYYSMYSGWGNLIQDREFCEPIASEDPDWL